ncbi:MAG: ribonuclease P protein component [Sumerlaeia bacterium]
MTDSPTPAAPKPLSPRGEGFPSWIRIVRGADYRRVQSSPVSCARKCLVFKAERRDDEHTPTRMGLVVSRRVDKRAVGRNRIKRLLREAFRRMHGELAPGWDIVVIARFGAREANYADLRREFRACARQLGILPPSQQQTPPIPPSTSGEPGALQTPSSSIPTEPSAGS